MKEIESGDADDVPIEAVLKFYLECLDDRAVDDRPSTKVAFTEAAAELIRERGGHYDWEGVRYEARGDTLYRTLPT